MPNAIVFNLHSGIDDKIEKSFRTPRLMRNIAMLKLLVIAKATACQAGVDW